MPSVVLVLLVLALSTRNADLLSVNSLLTIADSAAPLAVLAIGATLVILCGGIDLSIAALSSVLLALWTPSLGAAAALPVIAVAPLAGALQGFVHIKAKVNSFIVTLGGLALWSGIALVISGARTIPITDPSRSRTWTRSGGRSRASGACPAPCSSPSPWCSCSAQSCA